MLFGTRVLLLTLSCLQLLLSLLFISGTISLCAGNPKLIYQHNKENELVISNCKILTEKYKPCLFVSNAHAMLIIGAIVEGIYHNYFEYKRELFTLKDGGVVSIDWPTYRKDTTKLENSLITVKEYSENEREDDTPIVICLHGLSGSSTVNYMTHLTAKVLERGWKQACFNARGCGDTDLITPRGFNASYTDDIREVIQHIHNQYPRAPLFGVAFSLGANIFTKYLGEEGLSTPILAAVALCNPFNLDITTAHMNSSFVHRTYNKRMADSLVNYVVQHKNRFSQPSLAQNSSPSLSTESNDVSQTNSTSSTSISVFSSPSLSSTSKPTLVVEEVKKAKTIRDFDREYILPQFTQYKTVEDYYKDSSSIRHVEGIEIPLLCVQSIDDPLCPPTTWPSPQFFLSKKNIILCATHRGSHVSWIEGSNPFHRYAWSDRAITEYIACILQHRDLFSH